MKTILHYGLQRSGTNFLENLLVSNFQVNVANSNDDRKHPRQKHFRLYEEKDIIPEPQYKNEIFIQTFGDFERALEMEQVDGILVISKDPYSWLISYKNWAKKCHWPETEHHYIEEYNLFYGKWMELSVQTDKVMFVKYLDLLQSSSVEIRRIKQRFNLKYKFIRRVLGPINSIKGVPQSEAFTSKKIQYYMKKEYLKQYSLSQLDEINQLMDSELTLKMGYKLEDTI